MVAAARPEVDDPVGDQARWWARDARTASRELAQALEDQGRAVTAVEVASGASWASWRARTDRILELFFPLTPSSL